MLRLCITICPIPLLWCANELRFLKISAHYRLLLYFSEYNGVKLNVEIINTANTWKKLNEQRQYLEGEDNFWAIWWESKNIEWKQEKWNGKRSRSHQRINIQDNVAAWLGQSTAEMFVDMIDGEQWKVMIVYTCKRDGNLKNIYIVRTPGFISYHQLLSL